MSSVQRAPGGGSGVRTRREHPPEVLRTMPEMTYEELVEHSRRRIGLTS